ncbi:hypothetical protein BX616_006803, partial [Lobosporangium transversale]
PSESKIERYRKKQGEEAEIGRAISGMLKPVQGKSRWIGGKMVVVIGDGDFKGRK